MNKIMNFQQLFEYRAGQRIKTRWTKDDAVITLYYEKFGLDKLGVTNIEGFVNEYIGSTANSLKMQGLCIRYILSLDDPNGPTGLPDYSKAQEDAVLKYNRLTEPELREVVEKILDKITEEERLKNLIRAEEKKKEEERIEKEKKPLPVEKPQLNKFGRVMPGYKNLETDEEIPVKVGDTLTHKKFGKGTVLSVDGNTIEIKFADEEKILIYKPQYFI